MPTINEVLERVNRARPEAGAYDDATKASWLLELDGKLYLEVFLTHYPNADDEEREPPRRFPEDADKPLLVDPPHDNIYDLYVVLHTALFNMEQANYHTWLVAFNASTDEFRRYYNRTRRPRSAGYYAKVF